MVKEHPIIFSTDMVKAILDGRKTQTRRVIKPQPNWVKYIPRNCRKPRELWEWRYDNRVFHFLEDAWMIVHYCPYGQVGDRLWVREAWAGNNQRVYYKADMTSYGVAHDLDLTTNIYTPYKKMFPSPIINIPKWKPSIHMPRWASRITLEITGVRVERLQDISFGDIKAEGVWVWYDPWKAEGLSIEQCRMRFARLWDSLNAKSGCPFNSNPFVWVIEFKRLDDDKVPALSV